MSRDFVDTAGERWTVFVAYQIPHSPGRMRLLFERVRGGTRPREISNVPGELTDLTTSSWCSSWSRLRPSTRSDGSPAAPNAHALAVPVAGFPHARGTAVRAGAAAWWTASPGIRWWTTGSRLVRGGAETEHTALTMLNSRLARLSVVS
jgi:hypothetical protein